MMECVTQPNPVPAATVASNLGSDRVESIATIFCYYQPFSTWRSNFYGTSFAADEHFAVLDRTFYIYRNHFVLLAGIGSLLPAMVLVMQLAFIPLGFPPRATAKIAPEALVILLLGYFCCYGVIYLVGTALAGGATVLEYQSYTLGQGVTIGTAYQTGILPVLADCGCDCAAWPDRVWIAFCRRDYRRRRDQRFYRLYCDLCPRRRSAMMGIGVVVAVIWALAVFLGAVGAALFFYSKLALAIPACILEQLPVGVALRRSWYLTKGSVLRIMLVNLLTGSLALCWDWL